MENDKELFMENEKELELATTIFHNQLRDYEDLTEIDEETFTQMATAAKFAAKLFFAAPAAPAPAAPAPSVKGK